MSPFLLPLSDRQPEDPPAEPPRQADQPTEGEALDAYSRVIVTVAEKLGPAVVNLRCQSRRKQPRRRFRLRLLDHARRVPAHESPRGSRLQPDARALNDGREVGGHVVGADPWTDVAVVQAEASGLAPCPARRILGPASRPVGGGHRQSLRL